MALYWCYFLPAIVKSVGHSTSNCALDIVARHRLPQRAEILAEALNHEEPVPYDIGDHNMLLLSLALAYILHIYIIFKYHSIAIASFFLQISRLEELCFWQQYFWSKTVFFLSLCPTLSVTKTMST